jgi:hypothetical protein
VKLGDQPLPTAKNGVAVMGSVISTHVVDVIHLLPPWVTGLARNTEKIVDFMEISNK